MSVITTSMVGAYHFLRSGEDVAAHADLFLAQVDTVGIENRALGAAVDVEDPDDDPTALQQPAASLQKLYCRYIACPTY